MKINLLILCLRRNMYKPEVLEVLLAQVGLVHIKVLWDLIPEVSLYNPGHISLKNTKNKTVRFKNYDYFHESVNFIMDL